MGSKGGSSPNPYKQRRVSTLFLRVPLVDWPKVKLGEKTEFRTMPGEGSTLLRCYVPTPVVAYTVKPKIQEYDAKLMVLLDRRREPLWEISSQPDAIRREGFESYDEFRRYWRKRQRGVYRPMQVVWVWRIAPFTPDHVRVLGSGMMEHLYGDFLDR